MTHTTIRNIAGLDNTPASIANSALILIDCQNTYREGVMKLEGVELALEECKNILGKYRQQNRPVIHIQHDAGEGSPYDLTAHNGAIADIVAPIDGEKIIVKNFPSSFEQTDLHETLKAQNIENLVLVGFMTHMCVNSTARAGFNLGYHVTVVSSATASRSLPLPDGAIVSADMVHKASLAGMNDLVGVVISDQNDLSS